MRLPGTASGSRTLGRAGNWRMDKRMCETAFSVIMPVYNSEKYLIKAVRSILRQTFADFELLLIDDGSTDSSGSLCQQLAGEDSRIKVFHKENGGICSARNFGLARACGKYVAFCDNDDLFAPDLLRDNYELAEQYHADVVRFSRKKVTISGSGRLPDEVIHFQKAYIPASEFFSRYSVIDKAGEGVWAGIYRRDYIEKCGARFDEGMRYGYEDLDFILQLYEHVPSVVLNPKVYYAWIFRYEHSTSGKTDINNIDSLIRCLKRKEGIAATAREAGDRPEFWVRELSDRIYAVVRYVGDDKVRMPFTGRMRYIRYFSTAPFFRKKQDRAALSALLRHNKSAWIVYTLFRCRLFPLLYVACMLRSYKIRLRALLE